LDVAALYPNRPGPPSGGTDTLPCLVSPERRS
jgi:hypothetical protein